MRTKENTIMSNIKRNVSAKATRINVAAKANNAHTISYVARNNLKELRMATGMKQVDLARKMGLRVWPQTKGVGFVSKAVSKWENGQAYPNYKNLALLRVIFGDDIRVERDMDNLKVV